MSRIVNENGMPVCELPDVFELREFTPCVIENAELSLTEMLLQDAMMTWCPLTIPGVTGHCVDLGYDEDGRLVGIKVWASVATRDQLDAHRAKNSRST